MVKIKDVDRILFSKKMDPKTCACMIFGASLTSHFGIDNVYTEEDLQQCQHYLNTTVDEIFLKEFRQWHYLLLQLSSQLKSAEIRGKDTVEQVWFRIELLIKLETFLRETKASFQQPKIFASQKLAKEYLRTRNQLAYERITRQPVGLNELLYYFVKQQSAKSAQWPCFKQHIASQTVTSLVKSRLGDDHKTVMTKAAKALVSFCKKQAVSFQLPNVDESAPLIDEVFFARPNWVEEFTQLDGFDEHCDVVFPAIPIGDLASKGLHDYQARIDADYQHKRDQFIPLRYQAPPVVSVATFTAAYEQVSEGLSQRLSLLKERASTAAMFTNVAMEPQSDSIKQLKTMQHIITCLARLTGLPLTSTGLSKLDGDLNQAYWALQRKLNNIYDLLTELHETNLDDELNINLRLVASSLGKCRYDLIEVPTQHIEHIAREWLIPESDYSAHQSATHELIRIMEMPWHGLDVFT